MHKTKSKTKNKIKMTKTLIDCKSFTNQNPNVQIYSRRHQHYHSQRSTRTVDLNSHHQRPTSTYYEYETFQYNGGIYNPNMTSPASNFNHHVALNGSQRKIHNGQSPLKYRTPNGHGGSTRSRGPFVTQVNIGQSTGNPHSPPSNGITNASKVWHGFLIIPITNAANIRASVV